MAYDDKNDPISWFFQDLMKPLFSHAEVLTLAGDRLKHDTLQNWTNRKYLEPKMINRKRRYSPLEVSQILMAQPMISRFFMDPPHAILNTMSAIHAVQRKLKSKSISPKQAPQLLCIFAEAASYDPAIVLVPAAKLFQTDEAFLVLPIGRLLNDLAQKQKQLVEARSARKAA